MRAFADLLETIVLTPSRNGKLRLLTDYLRRVPDPDRGYGLAAIAGGLDIPSVKPAMLRALAGERVDAELFALSYDYVGDLAETIALIWPDSATGKLEPDIALGTVVTRLQAASRSAAPAMIAELLDALAPSARFALLKLVTGGLRIGISARLAKQALADLGGRDVAEIEEIWPGQQPPYLALFDWLDGKAERPVDARPGRFRPVMLAHPIDPAAIETLNPEDYAAEWKWDGIRIQAVHERGVTRLYTRTGDDISAGFPDLAAAMDREGALDGELLIGWPQSGALMIGSFSDLQQRLNRKTVTKSLATRLPAIMRCYDLLVDGPEDLRAKPLWQRRERLEQFVQGLDPTRFDLSEQLSFDSPETLARLRADPPEPVIEGLMLKRHDSAYIAGRPKGPWFKWKRDPFTVDAVLIYAQRGHGKRSGFYSDYTFAVWDGAPEDGGQLVPVGKAYSGFTDDELKEIDRFVRTHTVERFGPVRSVRAQADFGLVLEIAFEGLNRSSRHKSGVAMRFPRIARLRRDKLPRNADRLQSLAALL